MTSVTYLLIGALEAHCYYLFRANAIIALSVITLFGFIVTFGIVVIKKIKMKVFKLLLVSITYLLIGVLELYGYFLFKTDVIGLFAFITLWGFIVTFMSELDSIKE